MAREACVIWKKNKTNQTKNPQYSSCLCLLSVRHFYYFSACVVIVLLISSWMFLLTCVSEKDYVILENRSVFVGMKSYFLKSSRKIQKIAYMLKGLCGSVLNFYQEVVRVLLWHIHSISSSPIVIIAIILFCVCIFSGFSWNTNCQSVLWGKELFSKSGGL